jgi:transposase
MIALPAKTRIWIAVGVTDLRRGFTGLSALVQTPQAACASDVVRVRFRRDQRAKTNDKRASTDS